VLGNEGGGRVRRRREEVVEGGQLSRTTKLETTL